MSDRLQLGGVLWLVCFAACAGVDAWPDFERARAEIRASTGVSELHDPGEPPLAESELATLLADGLGLEEATRLALRENRRLQAGFQALGVARAEYVQAGLFENPSLSLAFLFPDAGRVRWTADLLGSVTDLWRIPARQALAEEGLEQRLLELSRLAGELVAATRAAYCESVAARAERSIAAAYLALARRSLAAVRRQVEAGVATATDASLAESLALGAELEAQRAERAEVMALRALATLLSFNGDLLTVELVDPLPAPAVPVLEREGTVQASLVARADVRASERAVAAARAAVALERQGRIPALGVGLSAERSEGSGSGDALVGPAAAVELPLFDQNRAQASRAEFELAQRTKEHEALLAEVGQGVRVALDRAVIASRAATFARDELLPQAERGVVLAERAHELGDTTVLTLLEAQRAVLSARRAELATALEAALARIALEEALGAPLEGTPSSHSS